MGSRAPALFTRKQIPDAEILEQSGPLQEYGQMLQRDLLLLRILLCDRTTNRNILWGTADYVSYGPEFGMFSEITPELITEKYAALIRPRVSKPSSACAGRTRDKGEVFTPSWVCNKQNNLIDQEWFGRENVFNTETGESWTAAEGPILFEGCGRTWKEYVDARRLEITCGEAPYLVSRYDTVTGEAIPLGQRIGFLDRKMRIVRENAASDEEWLTWSQRAFESVYAYEYQGDSLLLARMNLLCTYVDWHLERFQQMPDAPQLRKIAYIISWNIWQMDGLRCVVPGSCRPEGHRKLSLPKSSEDTVSRRENSTEPCPGCAGGDIFRHIGTYCRIMDWRAKRSQTYLSLLRQDKL